MEGRNTITEKILQLTLEIIYLLTGEDYKVVKKSSGDHVTHSHCSPVVEDWSSITVPPPNFLTPERNNNKKIVEVTNRILELLAGEVPIRCEDVTVFFTMEEWDYIEGHKDLYKDIMMENRPPCASPDGPTNCSPPEACTSPPHSPDTEMKNHSLPQHYQNENMISIKVEVKEEPEEMHVRSDEPCKEEEIPAEISTDVQHDRSNLDNHSFSCPVGETKHDGITSDSSECISNGSNFQPVLHSFAYFPMTHHSAHTYLKTFPGSEPGECFPEESSLIKHHPTRPLEKPHACTDCGRAFTLKNNLVAHQKLHLGEKPYLCTNCGKAFAKRSNLVRHQIIHTGEKPFSCSDCGRFFNDKSNLRSHQKNHTIEKPFKCSQCGISFTEESHMVCHLEAHAANMVLPCSECGKCFTRKSKLITHKRIHTDIKPYSCSECGRYFSKRSNLTTHLTIHSKHKQFSCMECGRSFTDKSTFHKHQANPTNEMVFPCGKCGLMFTRRACLIYHYSTHTSETSVLC
ncbi:zinc finger protein OZF-like isoform X2 [Hyperolius riggenbachi]